MVLPYQRVTGTFLNLVHINFHCTYIFYSLDVHVLSVLKADETYDNIAQGMQTPLKQINDLIKAPNVSINGKTYEIEIFLCADYKVCT